MVDSSAETGRSNTEAEVRLAPTLKFSQASKEEGQNAFIGTTLLGEPHQDGLAIILNHPLDGANIQEEVQTREKVMRTAIGVIDKSDPAIFSLQLRNLLQQTLPHMSSLHFAIAQEIQTEDGVFLVSVARSSPIMLLSNGRLDNRIENSNKNDLRIKVEGQSIYQPLWINAVKLEPGDKVFMSHGGNAEMFYNLGSFTEFIENYSGDNLAQAYVDFQYQKRLLNQPEFDSHTIAIECSNEERKVKTQPALVARRVPVMRPVNPYDAGMPRPTGTVVAVETAPSPEQIDNTESLIRIQTIVEAYVKDYEQEDLNAILDEMERLDLNALNEKELKYLNTFGKVLLEEGRSMMPEFQIQTQLINERLLRAISNTNPDFDRADKLLEIAKLLGLDEDPITGKILTTVNSVLTKAKIANMHAKPTPTLEPISPVEPPPKVTPSPITSQPEAPPTQPAPINPGGLPDWLFLNESDTQQDISSILATGSNPFAMPGSAEPAATANPSSVTNNPSETTAAAGTAEAARPAVERVITPDVLKLRDDLTDVVEQINLGLDLTEKDSISFEGTPQLLENYLKTLQINGAQVSEVRAFINDDGFLDLSIGIKGKTDIVRFRGKLESDLQGNIVLHNHILKGGLLTGRLEGEIKKQVQDLNKTITDSLNKQIRSGWEVKGFSIKNGKIAIDFGKESTTVDVQSGELTRDQQVDAVFKYVREEARKRNVPIQIILDELKQ